MDAPLITDLPTSAQRVLADHLGPSNAARCRLASRQLSNVASDRAGSRLWVVANTFRTQIDHDADIAGALDEKRSLSKAWRDAGGPHERDVQGFTEPLVNAVDEGLLTASSLARAAEGVVCAEVWVDASRPCEGDTWQALFRSLLSSSTLQELTITEYCSHNADGLPAALKNREISSCSPFSWSKAQQQSSTQPTEWDPHKRFNRYTLSAADCGWLPALVHAAIRREGGLGAQQQQQGASASSAAAEAAAAAFRREEVQPQQRGQQQQQQESTSPLRLSLQLLAPLLPEHSILLLRLRGLAALCVFKTPAWVDCQSSEALQGRSFYKAHVLYDGEAAAAAAAGADGQGPGALGFQPPEYRSAAAFADAPVPVLPTSTLRALRELPQLAGLSGTVGRPMMHNEKPGEVGTMLQQLLLDLGPQFTQLSLGTLQSLPGRPTVHYSLSAPLRGMPALRSLTCNLGFSLDVESDLDDAAMLSIHESAAGSGAAAAAAGASDMAAAGAAAGATSSSSRVPRALPAMLFPSLTKLVLVDPACVPDVLEQLADSEAACRQLRYLSIPALAYDDEPSGPDYNAYLDQQQQQQRRQDPGVVSLQHLGRLQGLCELQCVTRGPWQLEALVAAVGSQLQGLTVTTKMGDFRYAPAHRVAMPDLDPLLTEMTHLTSLKIIGGAGAVLNPHIHFPAAAKHLTALRQLSYTGRINSIGNGGMPGVEFMPGMLPTTLQGLTIVACQADSGGSDRGGRYDLHPGGLPEGLASLKCRGFFWERLGSVDPWSLWVGWELLPAGLRRLELDVEGALPNAGGCGIWPVSSASQRGAGAVNGAAAADIATGADVADLDPSWEPLPQEVELPALDSLALYVYANRHAEPRSSSPPSPPNLSGPPALCLSQMCDHLSGLTALTHLHISSTLRHDAEESLTGLEPLVCLKLLTLHVGLHGSAILLNLEPVQELVGNVMLALAKCSGLHVLRLPRLSLKEPYTLMDLEAQHPNCLVMESQDEVLSP